MTTNQKESLQKLAKGTWQAQILKDLLTGHEVTNPVSQLRGRAKNFSGKYQLSFHSLISRLKNAGINITIKAGPKGGMWSATYKIIA